MATFSLKPKEPLHIDFADGVRKTAIFDNRALFIFTAEFGDIEEVANREAENNPYEFGSKILYCGLKTVDNQITLDEARAIVGCGGDSLLLEISNLLISNFMMSASEESKKKFMTEMDRFLKGKLN